MSTSHSETSAARHPTGLLSISAIKIALQQILFVGDSKAAAIFAFDLGPAQAASGSAPFNLSGINRKLADLFGVSVDEISIRDLAVHPISKDAYLAVHRGHAELAIPAIVRISTSGTITLVELDTLPVSKLVLSAPASADFTMKNRVVARSLSITDLAFANDELLIAGLSSADFSSTLYRARYPFDAAMGTSTVEIYHAVHDQNETRAPIRTMTVLPLNGQPHLLAVYTCTPLVTIPLADLKDGAHVQGKTIAELGYGNSPADVLHFQSQDMQGKTQEHVLIVNKHRGPLLFSLESLAERSAQEGMHDPAGFNVVAPPHMAVPMGGVLHVDDQDAQYLATVRHDTETGRIDLLSMRKGAFFRLSDHVSEYMLPGYVYPEKQKGMKQFQDLLWRDEAPTEWPKTVDSK